MTVKQLIEKLSKCDPEAIVLVENTGFYLDAYYSVTNVDTEDNFVLIESDHEKSDDALWEGEEE